MKHNNNIEELFKSKLESHEVPVNTELWQAIAAKIGSTTVLATGISLSTKILIAVGTASIVGAGAWIYKTNQTKPSDQKTKTTVVITSQENNTLTTKKENLEKTTIKSIENTPITQHEDEITTVSENLTTIPIKKNKLVEETIPAQQKNYTQEQTEIAPVLLTEKSSPIIQIQEENQAITSSNEVEQNPAENQIVKETQKNIVVLQEEKKPTKPQATFVIKRLPNIFILNTSGYFSIEYTGDYRDFQFTLMNQQNQVVFQSKSADFKWDGIDLGGNRVGEGEYFYIITARDQNGIAVNKYSSLKILAQ